jgi:5'-methylthioadenosine phosphorylase
MGSAMAQATDKRAKIGVFGGSGFYEFLEGAESIRVHTPYGPPSDAITLATIHDRPVAFLPRHGQGHSIPPHRIPYRANVWAMKSLGVEWIVSPAASGSLQPDLHPGEFVVLDQFVDRTSGRHDTFYDGPITTHIGAADPYCPTLRELAVAIGREQGITMHDGGTIVVIQGPRFSTRAESEWFTRMRWHVVNMTQYPECVLALEQEICYCGIAQITDYDVGVVGEQGTAPVNIEEVLEILRRNNERVKNLIFELVRRLPAERDCRCMHALEHARV